MTDNTFGIKIPQRFTINWPVAFVLGSAVISTATAYSLYTYLDYKKEMTVHQTLRDSSEFRNFRLQVDKQEYDAEFRRQQLNRKRPNKRDK